MVFTLVSTWTSDLKQMTCDFACVPEKEPLRTIDQILGIMNLNLTIFVGQCAKCLPPGIN